MAKRGKESANPQPEASRYQQQPCSIELRCVCVDATSERTNRLYGDWRPGCALKKQCAAKPQSVSDASNASDCSRGTRQNYPTVLQVRTKHSTPKADVLELSVLQEYESPVPGRLTITADPLHEVLRLQRLATPAANKCTDSSTKIC